MNGPQAQLIDLLKKRQGQLAIEESFGDVPRALASQPAGTVTVHTAPNSTEMQVMANVRDLQEEELKLLKSWKASGYERAYLVPLLKSLGPIVHNHDESDVVEALESYEDSIGTSLGTWVTAELRKMEMPETFFYARNQTEMSKAQEALVAWAEAKVRLLKKELKEVNENLQIATKRKWKKEPWERQVTKAAKKLTFYEKIEAALKAGYVIIPDMNVDLFAIRTTRKSAKENKTKGQWNRPRDQQTNSPPLGEGRYVTPQGEQVWANEVKKHEPGKAPEYEIARWVEGHDEEIDFPFRMAKPAILTATADAMAGKFFDEMGVLPQFRVQADPVVVGRITHKDGYHTRRFNFLVVWFIDTREL